MTAADRSGRVLGFDAVRALRNRTGLGNYARGVLRGLHRALPDTPLHLYSHRSPHAAFANLSGELGATLHTARGGALQGSLWRTFRLGRAARRDGVTLYHGLSHEIPRDLPETGIRSVVTFHDLIYERAPELFPRFDRWSYRWRYRWSARHADLIVADSHATRRDLIHWYGIDPARIAVVPPPRDPRFARVPDPDEIREVTRRLQLPARFALSVGTLEARKNQRVLIEAWAQLPLDAPRLVLAGRDGGEEATLRQLIRRHRLGDRVRIIGNVADADLPAVVHAALLVLYPSRLEGFGMPVVEALSAGRPLVAAAGAGVDDAGGTAARYLPPDDAAAWATTVRQLADDPAEQARLSDLGRRHSGRFDGDRVAMRLRAVYDAVIGGTPLPDDPQPTEAAVERVR